MVLDFAKAFDKVNHSLLVQKLDHYGVRGKTNRWIKNFLHDRQQAVVVEGSSSGFIPVRSGVPQGSVLGPCLFLVYINDMPSHVSSNTRLFADDTAVDRQIKTNADPAVLQKDLDALSRWEHQWDMQFHPGKCNVLAVQRCRKPAPPRTYTLHGQELETVSSVKYLGVTVQNDGNWDQHINGLVSKANSTLGFLRRNLKIRSRAIKDTAYKALVRPLLEYSAAIWDPHLQKEIDALEKVQRRAARFVLHQYDTSSSVDQMLQELNWPTLARRRQNGRLTLFYKIVNDLVSVHCPNLTPSNPRSRRTHQKQYDRVTCRTEYRNNAFLPRTVREWNALPPDVALAPSLDVFASRVQRLDL